MRTMIIDPLDIPPSISYDDRMTNALQLIATIIAYIDPDLRITDSTIDDAIDDFARIICTCSFDANDDDAPEYCDDAIDAANAIIAAINPNLSIFNN